MVKLSYATLPLAAFLIFRVDNLCPEQFLFLTRNILICAVKFRYLPYGFLKSGAPYFYTAIILYFNILTKNVPIIKNKKFKKEIH